MYRAAYHTITLSACLLARLYVQGTYNGTIVCTSVCGLFVTTPQMRDCERGEEEFVGVPRGCMYIHTRGE